MHLKLAPLLSLALTSTAIGIPRQLKVPTSANGTSVGCAIVSNHCDLPLYIWSVGQNISPQTVIPPGQNYSETYRHDIKTGGIAIKITTVEGGLYNSAPQTVFAYNIVNSVIWYDLSDVFGDPFRGDSVMLLPSEPIIRWEEGVPPRGSQVRRQESSKDLILTLC